MARWSRASDEGGEVTPGCPGCSALLEWMGEDGAASCGSCGWRGRAWQYDPLPLMAESAKQALPEDATCAHHPTKRAEAVCAGTGDFICSLCTVSMEGETYSAQYLERAGKGTAGRAFERKLDRPDSAVVLFLLLCFVPYVNGLWLLGTPIWGPLGYVKLAKAARLRREDPLMDRLVSPARLWTLGILLTLLLGLILLVLGLMLVGILSEI